MNESNSRKGFYLIHKIYEQLWDTFLLDFQKNYDLLIKKFGNISLFSVCLHFLKCRRSCEQKSAHCRFCLRVRENNFYKYNAFLSWQLSNNDYLTISSSSRVDFDVFSSRPPYF